MNILQIDSSITGATSVSRQLTARIVEGLSQAAPGSNVVRRDLEAQPLPHLDHRMLSASFADSPVDPQTRDDLETSAKVLDEFLKADVVVIGAPMYNFTISSQLKAWIDRILIAGKTFKYTTQGPQGLAGGKKVIIASSRGGFYGPSSAQAAFDFQENYLRAVFAFIGIDDVEIVRAEGLAVGPEQKEAALLRATEAVAAITRSFAPTLAA